MSGLKGDKPNPYMGSALLSVAAWLELEATIKTIEALTLRGVPQSDIESLRQRAHDILDEHMDHKQGLCALSRSKS